MKVLSVLAIIIGLFTQLPAAQAQSEARTQIYSCQCIDTGMECDGGERMQAVIRGNQATVTVAAEDGSFPNKYKAVYDATFAPTKNKDFFRYKITSPKKQLHPHFLIKKSMIKGSKSGVIKMPEVSDNGMGYEWYYECQLQGAQG